MAEITGAGTPNVEKKPCGWAGGDCKHTEIKDTLQQDGKVNRKDGSIRGWARPNCYFDNPNMPRNKDDDGNLELFVRVPNSSQLKQKWRKKKRYLEDYLIQRHHVIPCAVVTAILELKTNLKSLGWDINDQQLNGICLPAYAEGIFWHDLPRHCGYPAKHATYNTNIEKELRDNWNEEWKDFCKNDEETKLRVVVQNFVNEKRDLIIQWNSSVFLVNDNLGDRINSFKNAGYTVPPKPSPQNQRKYAGNAPE